MADVRMSVREPDEVSAEAACNLVPNPRFHIGVDEWEATDWSKWGPGTIPTRVTSVPFGGLPAGADAAGSVDAWATGVNCVLTELVAGNSLPLTVTYAAHATGSGNQCLFASWVNFYGTDWDDWMWTSYMTETTTALDEWHVASETFVVPEGATFANWYVTPYPGFNGATDSGDGYVTLLRAGGLTYADGDSDGWEWDATAHASISRGATTQPAAAFHVGHDARGLSMAVAEPGAAEFSAEMHANGVTLAAFTPSEPPGGGD